MANLYDQSITLDISGRNNGPLIHAKQGDKDSRLVHITLVEDGIPFQVQSGTRVEFRCHKPSGYICDNPAELNSDGTVTVTLSEQSLAEAGLVIADIALRDGTGKILSSSTFQIRVTESAANGDKIDSTNEMQILNQLIDEATEIVEEYNGTLDAVTPSIGANGNWYVGGKDTGVKAQGKDGDPGPPGPSSGDSFKIMKNITVAANQFTAFTDSEINAAGYGYRAVLPLEGALESMVPSISYSPKDSTSRIFAPFADSYDGGIYLYAARVPDTTVTLSTIILFKEVA